MVVQSCWERRVHSTGSCVFMETGPERRRHAVWFALVGRCVPQVVPGQCSTLSDIVLIDTSCCLRLVVSMRVKGAGVIYVRFNFLSAWRSYGFGPAAIAPLFCRYCTAHHCTAIAPLFHRYSTAIVLRSTQRSDWYDNCCGQKTVTPG